MLDAGTLHYWIVTLIAQVVEVHRQPRRLSGHHASYTTVTIARPGESIRTLAASQLVAIDDLLP